MAGGDRSSGRARRRPAGAGPHARGGLGRLDEALARLEEALARGYRDVADLRLARLNEPLRDDPRLEPLLARYGCPR